MPFSQQMFSADRQMTYIEVGNPEGGQADRGAVWLDREGHRLWF